MAAKEGKRIKAAKASFDNTQAYSLADAVALVKGFQAPKFDQTVDIAIQLGVDPKRTDEAVRGTADMPNGLGKDVRVAVFAKGDKAAEAKKAGADIVGDEDLAEKIKAGEINFDCCIATPDMMPMIGQQGLGKVLGPRGLMPNPKLGTVTNDVAQAIKANKSGRVEFKIDKAGIIHAGIGKASFTAEALLENIKRLLSSIEAAKPAGFKGVFIKKVAVSATMSPGVSVDTATV